MRVAAASGLAVRALTVTLPLVVALSQTACRGCESPPSPRQSPSPPPPDDAAVALPAPNTPTTAPTAMAPPAETPTPTAGPAAVDASGFRISTGFLDRRLQPLPQPQARATTQVVVTALDPQGRTLGQLAPVADQQMHGFLVAKDLRHVRYAAADRPVRENADARALPFAPPGGGDHALIALFQPVGGQLHAVTAPVTVAGNLPTVAGPGVSGLLRLPPSGPHALTLLPPTPHAGDDVDLRLTGPALPFIVAVDAAMAHATALLPTPQGTFHWVAPQPGLWLLLVPSTARDALTEDVPAEAFALVVAPPAAQ